MSPASRTALAILLALLVNGAYVGLLVLLSYIQPSRPPPKPASAVALRPLSSAEWAKNRGDVKPNPPAPQAPAKEGEKNKPAERPEGQVVDVAPGNDQEAPDAKYLAESNNRVEKETRSREQTPFYRNAMPQRTALQAQQGSGASEQQSPQAQGNGGLARDEKPQKEGGKKSAFEVPDIRSREEIALKTDPDSAGPGMDVANRAESDPMVGNSKRLRIQEGEEGSGDDEGSQGHVGQQGRAILMPSQAVMDQIIGAAPNDHLKDVEEGEGTYLNTREWKYSSFFNRVKQGVSRHWDPNAVLLRRDPTGTTYAGRDRHTMVNVTLDERGNVEAITIEKSCGLDFLDMEAVNSFKRAQPFPNPPPGLLEEDSKVRFQFGFFMDMGGGPRMRLFRQPN